jgi:hypothetical protein
MNSKRMVLTIAAITSAALAWGLVASRYELFPFGPGQQFVHLFCPPPPPVTVEQINALSKQAYEQKILLHQMSRGRADVVMLGDSITFFPDWRELFPGLNIANRGVGGDTTDGALKRLNTVISLHPRKVFVMLGVNELWLGQSPDAVLSNYTEIVRQLSATGIIVIAQSVLLTKWDEINQKIATFNQMLSRHCQQTGLCRYIDLTTKISPSDTYDGIHPTAKAYDIWRAAIAAEISNVR